jgi:hypothetical protein
MACGNHRRCTLASGRIIYVWRAGVKYLLSALVGNCECQQLKAPAPVGAFFVRDLKRLSRQTARPVPAAPTLAGFLPAERWQSCGAGVSSEEGIRPANGTNLADRPYLFQ